MGSDKFLMQILSWYLQILHEQASLGFMQAFVDVKQADEVVHHGNNDDSIVYEETDNDENAMLD